MKNSVLILLLLLQSCIPMTTSPLSQEQQLCLIASAVTITGYISTAVQERCYKSKANRIEQQLQQKHQQEKEPFKDVEDIEKSQNPDFQRLERKQSSALKWLQRDNQEKLSQYRETGTPWLSATGAGLVLFAGFTFGDTLYSLIT